MKDLNKIKNKYAGFDTSNEKHCLYQIGKYAHYIDFISNPSEAVQMAAVRKESYAIQFIKYPTEAVQLYCVRDSGALIRHIKEPTGEAVIEAVKQHKQFIRYIDIDRLSEETRDTLMGLL